MRRSLVLAGGGMRVAWQTGVVQALTEHGLEFQHVDGTSGGIMTTGMLLSGQQPAEMGRRWSDLDVQDFSSPLPVRDYLRGPWALPGLGDSDGVVHKVFPHLGIDCEAIRSSTVEGTFNVVDFVTKTCVAVPHTEVDEELLAAGMSLPLVMPPLRRGDRVWTDAVWVKDANVTEALRRGADEVWLVWCIGNSPYWGDGPLEQYVHMIEMSANGALFAELDAARAAGRSFRLHVVRPVHPLPLDSELFAGRISTDTLVAWGYRDAWLLPRPGRSGRCRAGRHLHRDDRAAGRRPRHRAVPWRARRRGPDDVRHGRADPGREGGRRTGARRRPRRPRALGRPGPARRRAARAHRAGPGLPRTSPGRRPVGGDRGGPAAHGRRGPGRLGRRHDGGIQHEQRRVQRRCVSARWTRPGRLPRPSRWVRTAASTGRVRWHSWLVPDSAAS